MGCGIAARGLDAIGMADALAYSYLSFTALYREIQAV